MVKVLGPLFSLSAKGSMADCITYQGSNFGPVVKALRFPTYYRSTAQGTIRDTFTWCSSIWANMHDSKKILWQDYEDYKGLVGYASFMNYMLKRTYLFLYQFELPPDIGFCITGNHVTGDFITGGAVYASGSDVY